MKLLFFTNVFPSPISPTKGTFNRDLACALGKRNEVRVVSPVSWLDELTSAVKHRRRLRPRTTKIRDVSVRFPRFLYFPKLGHRFHAAQLWGSVRSALKQTCQDWRPDCVLGYWAHPDGTVAVRFSRTVGARAWVMVGGSDVLLLTRNATRRRLIVDTLKAANGVVAVSQHLKSKLVDLGVCENRIEVLYRGVDLQKFSPGERTAARQRLAIDDDGDVLVWVGRMVPVKGLTTLIAAIQLLKHRNRRIRLYLCGQGPLRGALEQQALALGVSDMIRFVGPVCNEELVGWYRAANAVVLPSLSEGVPNVLLEGHACGIPFVASRVGGVPEICIQGVDQLVTAGVDIELADAIDRVLDADVHVGALRSSVRGLDAAADELARIVSG